MSNYIINPNVFYWVSVINTFHYIFWVFGVISLILGMIMLLDNEVTNKTGIIWVVFGVVFILLGTFLPSKEVMYQMLVSKYITKDIAMKGLDYINNVVNQLLNN